MWWSVAQAFPVHLYLDTISQTGNGMVGEVTLLHLLLCDPSII